QQLLFLMQSPLSKKVALPPIGKEVPMNWHENFIVYLASVLRPKVYVELGLYRCKLFNQIVPYAERLIGLDTEESAGTYMTKSAKTEFHCMTTADYAK